MVLGNIRSCYSHHLSAIMRGSMYSGAEVVIRVVPSLYFSSVAQLEAAIPEAASTPNYDGSGDTLCASFKALGGWWVE